MKSWSALFLSANSGNVGALFYCSNTRGVRVSINEVPQQTIPPIRINFTVQAFKTASQVARRASQATLTHVVWLVCALPAPPLPPPHPPPCIFKLGFLLLCSFQQQGTSPRKRKRPATTAADLIEDSDLAADEPGV